MEDSITIEQQQTISIDVKGEGERRRNSPNDGVDSLVLRSENIEESGVERRSLGRILRVETENRLALEDSRVGEEVVLQISVEFVGRGDVERAESEDRSFVVLITGDERDLGVFSFGDERSSLLREEFAVGSRDEVESERRVGEDTTESICEGGGRAGRRRRVSR